MRSWFEIVLEVTITCIVFFIISIIFNWYNSLKPDNNNNSDNTEDIQRNNDSNLSNELSNDDKTIKKKEFSPIVKLCFFIYFIFAIIGIIIIFIKLSW